MPRRPSTLAVFAAVAAASGACFTPRAEDPCAALARRLCECGPAACEAAPRLLAAAKRLDARAGRDAAAACRSEVAAPLRCAGATVSASASAPAAPRDHR